MLSMCSASGMAVSMSGVCTVWPYACVSVVFIVCWMWCGVVLGGLALLSLLPSIRLGCILWGGYLFLSVYVGVLQFLGCNWYVGFWLGTVYVSSLEA